MHEAMARRRHRQRGARQREGGKGRGSCLFRMSQMSQTPERQPGGVKGNQQIEFVVPAQKLFFCNFRNASYPFCSMEVTPTPRAYCED